MAAKEPKDDKPEGGEGEGQPKSKAGLIKIILIVVGALAFVGLNLGVTIWLVNSKSAPHEPAPAAEGAQGGAGPADAHGADKGDKAAANAADPAKPPVYYAFDPAFVVNFQAQDTLRFLQVKVEVMARDQKVVAAVEQHMPVIRNNLVVLFSSQDFTTISTRVGKERLRAQTLAEIQKVLKENTGQPGVEQVYFTSFVMQ